MGLDPLGHQYPRSCCRIRGWVRLAGAGCRRVPLHSEGNCHHAPVRPTGTFADHTVRAKDALLADVGGALDKWVFKVADARGAPDPLLGSVLQPQKTGAGVVGEGDVTLGPWTQLPNGLRSPNYRFSNGTPAKFSARIAPQLVGMGLLDAVSEATILEKSDPDDLNRDGISATRRPPSALCIRWPQP